MLLRASLSEWGPAMRKCLILLLTPLCFLWPFNVNSQALSEQTLITVIEAEPLKTVGTATFSVLFWDVYKSRLLTTSGIYPTSNNNGKVLFEIHYLKDIARKELIKRTIDQWQHIGLPSSDYQAYISQLQRIWPNIKAGDKLSLLIESSRSRFYFNDRHIGDIQQATFGQVFIDIWLSPKTSQPKLRRQLLGEKK